MIKVRKFNNIFLKILFILLLLLINSFANIISFNNNYSYAIEPSSERRYDGIDVSAWQGYIDYREVKEDGIEIVYMKASQGDNYKDPYFDINYRNAKENDLIIGVYHFLTATDEEEARQEARFFHKVIEDKEIDCKLAMDFESFSSLSRDEIIRVSVAFIDELKEITKKEVIIYSDLSNARDIFNTEELTKYPLWIAYYGDYRELDNIRLDWSVWTGVQYEDNGRVSGIRGNVDRDIFTEDVFLEDNSKIEKETTGKRVINTREVDYTVKRGDTLYDLAEKYNTTIDEIVNINNIRNRDLIYVGEKLKIIENTVDKGIDKRGLSNIFYTVKKRRYFI